MTTRPDPPRVTSPYWAVQEEIGTVALSPQAQLQVSAVQREGTWFVRLRVYRRAERKGAVQWVPGHQVLVLPLAAAASLHTFLQDAVNALATRALPTSSG